VNILLLTAVDYHLLIAVVSAEHYHLQSFDKSLLQMLVNCVQSETLKFCWQPHRGF
jgi:hypothetical protein